MLGYRGRRIHDGQILSEILGQGILSGEALRLTCQILCPYESLSSAYMFLVQIPNAKGPQFPPRLAMD